MVLRVCTVHVGTLLTVPIYKYANLAINLLVFRIGFLFDIDTAIVSMNIPPTDEQWGVWHVGQLILVAVVLISLDQKLLILHYGFVFLFVRIRCGKDVNVVELYGGQAEPSSGQSQLPTCDPVTAIIVIIVMVRPGGTLQQRSQCQGRHGMRRG